MLETGLVMYTCVSYLFLLSSLSLSNQDLFVNSNTYTEALSPCFLSLRHTQSLSLTVLFPFLFVSHSNKQYFSHRYLPFSLSDIQTLSQSSLSLTHKHEVFYPPSQTLFPPSLDITYIDSLSLFRSFHPPLLFSFSFCLSQSHASSLLIRLLSRNVNNFCVAVTWSTD